MTEPLLDATRPSIAAMAASLTPTSVMVSGRQWTCHRLPPSEVRYITLLYGAVLMLTTASVTNEARCVARLLVGERLYPMNYLKHLKGVENNLDLDVPLFWQQQQIEDTSDISPDQKEEAKAKVIGLAREFFQTLPPQFCLKDARSSAYDDFLDEMGYSSRSEIRVQHCGYTQVQRKLKLSSDDLAFLGLPRDEKAPGAKKMDCGAYAFLILREQRAREWILSSLGDNQPYDMKDSFYEEGGFTLLERWGYRPMESPASQDLAIYLGKRGITHIGIVQENGLIQSKIGIQDPRIYLHPIADILGQYGNCVLFFRR